MAHSGQYETITAEAVERDLLKQNHMAENPAVIFMYYDENGFGKGRAGWYLDRAMWNDPSTIPHGAGIFTGYVHVPGRGETFPSLPLAKLLLDQVRKMMSDPTVLSEHERRRQRSADEKGPLKLPKLSAIAELLREHNASVKGETEFSFHLYPDGNYAIGYGEDDHASERGWTGYATIPGNGRRFNATKLARNIADDIRESHDFR